MHNDNLSIDRCLVTERQRKVKVIARVTEVFGDICLKFDTGMQWFLHNVNESTDMRLNIISTVFLMKMVITTVSGMAEKKCSHVGRKQTDRAFRVVILLETEKILDRFGAAKMFHTIIYESLDVRHLLYEPSTKELGSQPRCRVMTEDQTLKNFRDDIQNDEEHDEEQVVKDESYSSVLGLRLASILEVSGLKGKEDYVCRLQKSLYGLKQAPRQWYKKFESVIGKQGFRKTFSDHCVFLHSKIMSTSFAMKDLRGHKTNPGNRIFPDRGARKEYEKMDKVLYATALKLNVCYVVLNNARFSIMLLSCQSFLSNPVRSIGTLYKWNISNLRGTTKLVITLENGNPCLLGYTNSDMAGNKRQHESTSGIFDDLCRGIACFSRQFKNCKVCGLVYNIG
ncbi:putative RNA-directed DNA polymerase [Tanacetum coccineum]